MSRIPQHFIDELLSRIDIVELIEERLPLKKTGKDYSACCPFHFEKTPSFTVSRTKQFYHCFGCGAHGTAIGFLMNYGRLDFSEAVCELAERVGLQVPTDTASSKDTDTTTALYRILEQAHSFFCRQLSDHASAPRANNYLVRRGLSEEVVQEFELGYAPPGWHNLVHALGQSEAVRDQLCQAGLVVRRSDGTAYDRFRDRLMFPIQDRRGRIIGFGGRVLNDGTPKYLNSPETALFQKRRELYGLFQVLRHRQTPGQVLVVEGYLDVLALVQFGIPYVVATLGTAVTTQHLERLLGVAAQVVFCFDGDRAGRTAAWRALDTVLPLMRDGRQVRFLFLPEGDDPDSLVRREGQEAFEARLAQAKGLTTYLFEHLLEQTDTTLEGRARLAHLAKPLLQKLPMGALRHLALQRLADLCGMTMGEAAILVAGPSQKSRHTASLKRSGKAPSLVRTMVTLLLQHPPLALQAQQAKFLAAVDLPGISLLRELIQLLAHRPQLSTGAIVEHFHEHAVGRHLAKLAVQESHLTGEALEREFADALQRLSQAQLKQRYAALTATSRERALNEEEKSEYRSLLQRAARSKPQDPTL